MSQSTETTRPDPLLDAYRQASEREGGSPSATVRAAVLAHARIVAQASGTAAAATGFTQATRTTPAANESKPIWRLAAGVVIGLVGVWIFQLTRPSLAPDTAVAVVETANAPSAPSAPQADKARAPEPVGAAAPAATVAVAAAPAAKIGAAKPATAAPTRQPDAALPEQNLAMAKAPAAKEKTDPPMVLSSASAAPASSADAFSVAMSSEIVIASAETRKSAKLDSRAEAATAVSALPVAPPAATPPPAAPNALPARTVEVAVAAAPAPRPAPSAAAPAVTTPAPGLARAKTSLQINDAASSTLLSESDLSMFRAVRSGDIPALRAAIARGVNVNAKDERGRTALQIARERADVETIKVLEAAGAR